MQMAVGKDEGAIHGGAGREIDVILNMDFTQAITKLRRVRINPRVELRLHCLSVDRKG